MELVHFHAVAKHFQGNGGFAGGRTPAPGGRGVGGGGGGGRGWVGLWLGLGRRRRGIGSATRGRGFHDGRWNGGRLIRSVCCVCVCVVCW